MSVKEEQHIPRQFLPLNELKEHLRNNNLNDIKSLNRLKKHLGIENYDTAEMMLNEIDKYVIDFPDEAVEVIKSNMK